MLRQRLFFLYLFILFTGIFAWKYDSHIQNGDTEHDDKNKFRFENPSQPSFDNNKYETKLFPSKTVNNDGYQQPNADQFLPQRSIDSYRQSSSTPLASSSECKYDLKKYCNKGSQKLISNLKVLQCVDDLDKAANLISKECQHLIYNFKYNMTHYPLFDEAVIKYCSNDITLSHECESFAGVHGSGRLVICLYDHLPNITDPTCRYFINQVQVVAFNDWRLTEYFVEACKPDIGIFECGRLDDDNQAILHEPGAVISCLSQKHNLLAPQCRKEIFRLAEMQSDDYHLDRALYFACRDEREHLCGYVASGNGRVYRCLYEQTSNYMMSPACRKEVRRRQSLVVANVKTDAPLIRACSNEIHEYNKCSVDPDEDDQKSSLVKLLLCLEEILKLGNNVQDECQREMLVHRRMLMSDYALLPELQSQCNNERIQYCPSLFQQGASGTIGQRDGRMIHCLLAAARKEKNFSNRCLSVVNSLVRAVDPGSDIRADPLLESTCRPVIDILCPRVKPGDSNVILCLLDNLKNARMTEDCEDRLMEVAYLLARDWRLTPRLLRTCQTSLVTFCHLPKDWSMNQDISGVQVGMYLGCLYQQRQQLDRKCRSELKRIMHIRTQSIGLMPEIEDNCLADLAICKNPEIKGEVRKNLKYKEYIVKFL
ncbi:unnamed protein product [Rotaria sp. Silwood2]|nr:unnamed protein product [Rotaria sp. Silwood2]